MKTASLVTGANASAAPHYFERAAISGGIWSMCVCVRGGTCTPDNGDTLTFDCRVPARWSYANTLKAMCEA